MWEKVRFVKLGNQSLCWLRFRVSIPCWLINYSFRQKIQFEHFIQSKVSKEFSLCVKLTERESSSFLQDNWIDSVESNGKEQMPASQTLGDEECNGMINTWTTMQQRTPQMFEVWTKRQNMNKSFVFWADFGHKHWPKFSSQKK